MLRHGAGEEAASQSCLHGDASSCAWPALFDTSLHPPPHPTPPPPATATQVAYRPGVSHVLGLSIPLEAAANRSEVQQFQERQQKRQKLKEEGAVSGGDAAAEAALPKVRRRLCG